MAKVFNLKSGRQTRRSLRKRMPEAEVILWSKLQRKQLGGYKFRRQFGIEVLRFTNDEVRANLDGVLLKIEEVATERERELALS